MANIKFQNDRAYYLAGNPIIIGIIGSRYRIRIGKGPFYRYYNGACFETTNYTQIDISELFERSENNAGITIGKIMIIDENGNESGIAENTIDGSTVFYVLGGGISKLMMRNLIKLNTDIFTEKLKNNNTNFLLTTRTNSNTIFIPENELLPLKYYGTGMTYTIKADGEVIFSADHTKYTMEVLFSIDLSLLREQVAVQNNKLISEFRFTKDDNFIFTVLLTEAKSNTRYFIDFINSWGVRERVAIHGIAEYAPELKASDKIKKYDTEVNDFTPSERRKKTKHIYSVNLGIRDITETLFLLDLFQSDQVWLVIDKYEFKAFLTGDNAALANTNGIPVEVKCKLELADEDEYFCPLLMQDGELYLTSGYQQVTTRQNSIIV